MEEDYMHIALTTVRIFRTQTKWEGAKLLLEIELPPGRDARTETTWLAELFGSGFTAEPSYYYDAALPQLCERAATAILPHAAE